MKTVLIHYCGGCNPRYDRTALAERLQRAYPRFRYVFDPDMPADLSLAICGCGVGCAAKGHDNAPLCAVAVEEQDEAALRAALQELKMI